LRLLLPPRRESVPEARHAVGEYAVEVGAPRTEVESFVSEAVANAVLHGFPLGEDGAITVDAQLTFDGHLLVRVIDDGVGISPNQGPRGLGFGIALMATVARSVEIERQPHGGTGVFARFPVNERATRIRR
jgi:anti-sigma regulatory factor (Ser/Thr protein kinase)